jgi:hypothetical protein
MNVLFKMSVAEQIFALWHENDVAAYMYFHLY